MKYHAVDSITLMKAIELIHDYNWQKMTAAQSGQQEHDETASLVLTSLRNALNMPMDEPFEHQ